MDASPQPPPPDRTPDSTPEPAPPPAPDPRAQDLAEVIQAYNQVTEKLQHSHEKLKSEVLRLRRELASTNAQLQRSKRLSALGEMAAGIAHEIRNPLGAIQLYATMVRDDLAQQPGLDDAADNARKIASAVHGLNGIVNDVLSFAREIQPQPAPLDVCHLFSKAVDAHAPAIEAAGVHLCRHDLQQPALHVHADPALVHQALLNLIRNAVDAMSGVPAADRSLTLEAYEDDAAVTLCVADTGPGIESDDIDRIFNPFFTTRNTGTGLGLAIVHRIVDAHAGTIVASKRQPRGALFKLTLPGVQPADAASQRQPEPRELVHAGTDR